MKISTSKILTICLLCFFSCHKSEEVYSDCLEDKIEEFKQRPWAGSIVKIYKPGEALFWFIDSIADAGEDVLNEACEVVCITDCYCTGVYVYCDASHLDYPMKTIWEK